MAYPIANAPKTHLDATTDDPSQARAELATLVDKFNELLGLLSQAPVANQVPVLASDGELTPITGLSLEHMGTYHRQIRNHSGGAGQIMLCASSGPSLNANCYFDGSSWRYIANGPAMHILCDGTLGRMRLYTASSGVAGEAVTFGAECTVWHSGNHGANLTATTTWNPGNLAAAGNYTTTSVSVTGAAPGDAVVVTPPNLVGANGVNAVHFFGVVSAADTVTICISAISGAVDIPSGTWRVTVLKP